MTVMKPEVLVLAEAVAPPDGWWSTVRGCARAAAEGGADALRVELAQGPALREADWVELRKEVLRLGLDFVVTVASEEEVALFRRVGVGGVAAWAHLPAGSDVAGDAGGPRAGLWQAVGAAHLPVYLLTGPTPGEAEECALGELDRYDVEVTVVAGALRRPAPPEGCGLGRLRGDPGGAHRARGFADRSGTGWPALAACVLGVDVLELPLALSPFLPGGAGSLDPGAFRRTVEGVRYLAWARAHQGSL